MKTPANLSHHRSIFLIWRMLSVLILSASLMGSLLTMPGSPAAASGQDCGDGQVWDDTQQMCVDQEPSDCGDGQVWDDAQQMCIDQESSECEDGQVWDDAQQTCIDQESSECGDGQVWDDTQQTCVDSPPDGSDQDGTTPTPSPTPTATGAGTGTLVVAVESCPPGYDLTDPNANPAADCTVPQDGVPVTYRGQGQPPVQQATAGGTTTFQNLAPSSFTVDAAAPAGTTASAWTCQNGTNPPVSGTDGSITGQIEPGEQWTCAFFLTGQPAGAGAAAATGTPAQGFAEPTEDTASILIGISLCPLGFEPPPGPGTFFSGNCRVNYDFRRYPISFTAFGTTNNSVVKGTNDTVFGGVDWNNNLTPDTYRIEAAFPSGISAILSIDCNDGFTSTNGTVTFLVPVGAKGTSRCSLALVRDPNVPTPTRIPRPGNSQLGVTSALCPAGFALAPGTVPSFASFAGCSGAKAGIQYSLSGPGVSATTGLDSLRVPNTTG
ncbi:MAG: hypothetical protein QM589_01075 [Thermomicrobiales bacterium]